ncbi:DNA ligase [Thiomicrorhabdus cannonii]|uniref:DNA ligase n=1 Tax=Thiomicrorhabdus cannonii TaxID=2748011 RepID=UPI0015C00886|nr:DNA ligase [Thiomicrorhabdus cannonii]
MLNLAKAGLLSFTGLFYLWLGVVPSAWAFDSAKPIEPSLVLLNTYSGQEEVQGWLLSEKLDGVRAYWDGKHLMSRQGKRFVVPDWFTENFPPFELDGELWMGRGQFENTVSIVNQQQPHNGWQQLSYQIFEVPNQAGGLLERLGVLKMYLQVFPAPYLHIIEQTAVSGRDEVANHLKEMIAHGGEGLVLRDPNTPYYAGRSAKALKVKEKQDAECIVQGYTQGEGKYQGQVGALLCEIVAGQFPALRDSQRVVKLGSGLSDQERREPPPKGTLVTFQYMGLTKNGLPRFPVYWRIRSDKSW